MERFRIVGELGRGGMATVLEAEDQQLRRRVALKLALPGSPTRRQRFEKEAQALARIRHPHIVGVHEVTQLQGRPCLVMDLIRGRSLAERLEKGPLSPRDAANLAANMADALQAAHDQGVLHRDVKPANILLTAEDDRPLLTDFGLARDAGEVLDRLTRTGEIVGTPSYMAPEQARGQKQLDGRVDVYGLGATLYALLTGEPPFERDSLHELLTALVDVPPTPPSQLRPEVPADLDTIVLTCLAKEPEARYATAAELAADLRRFARGDRIQARSPSRIAAGLRRSRSGPLIAGLALLGLATTVVWALASPNRRPPATPAPRPRTPAQPTSVAESAPPEEAPRAPLRSLPHPAVLGARFLTDDTAVSWSDSEVKVWTLDTGTCTQTLRVDQRVSRLAPSPDGKRLAFGSPRGFDVMTLGRRARMSGGGAAIPTHDVAWLPASDRVALCGEFLGVRIAKATTGLPDDEIALGMQAQRVATSPDGQFIVASSVVSRKEHELHMLSTRTMQRIGGWKINMQVLSLVFSDDSSAVYAGTESGHLLRFIVKAPPDPNPEVFSGPQQGSRPNFTAHRGDLLGLAVKGERIYSATGASIGRLNAKQKFNQLRVWDRSSRRCLGTFLETQRTRYVSLDLRGDRLLLASHEQGLISLWEAAAFDR